VRERGPDLLAIDDVVIAVAHGLGLERGEIGTGAGLGIALAPPCVVLDDAREVGALLLFRAERVDDRPGHVHAEGNDRRCTGAPELLVEGERLRRAPAETAMLLRPFAGDPALGAEPLQPGIVLVALEMLAERLLATDVGRQLALAEVAHLGAEGIERRIPFDGPDEHARAPSAAADQLGRP